MVPWKRKTDVLSVLRGFCQSQLDKGGARHRLQASPAGVQKGIGLIAHARGPELRQMVGGGGHRVGVRLAGEEAGEQVGLVGQVLGRAGVRRAQSAGSAGAMRRAAIVSAS